LTSPARIETPSAEQTGAVRLGGALPLAGSRGVALAVGAAHPATRRTASRQVRLGLSTRDTVDGGRSPSERQAQSVAEAAIQVDALTVCRDSCCDSADKHSGVCALRAALSEHIFDPADYA
jgi:hypothetical protein